MHTILDVNIIFFILAVIITYLITNWLLNVFKVGSIEGKYVFITGCDCGIGQVLALHLDALGFYVFAGCLTKKGCFYLSESASNNLTAFMVNVTKQEEIDNALQLIKNKLPENKGLWALINNAGILGSLNYLEMCSVEDYHQVLNVNLYGTIEITRNFLPILRKSKNSRIVNMSSVPGHFPYVGGPFACSSFGVESFSDILRREVYKQDIKVSIVESSGFRTSLIQPEQVTEHLMKGYEQANKDVKIIFNKDTLEKYKRKILKMSQSCSTDITPVLDAVVHAIIAKFPRTRYFAGGSSNRTFFMALAYLPDWISDWILKKIVVS